MGSVLAFLREPIATCDFPGCGSCPPLKICACTSLFNQEKFKCIERIQKKQISNNPLYTNGFILLVWYNKLGIVHCTYLGVSGYNFQKILYSFVWRSFLPFQTVQSRMKCSIYAAFHLGLHCLQKYLLRGYFIWLFPVCKSTHLGVSPMGLSGRFPSVWELLLDPWICRLIRVIVAYNKKGPLKTTGSQW